MWEQSGAISWSLVMFGMRNAAAAEQARQLPCRTCDLTPHLLTMSVVAVTS
jgi:hypothetical protein